MYIQSDIRSLWISTASIGTLETLRSAPVTGVGIAEIEALFARPVYVVPDPAHSSIEERKIALGLTAVGRAVFLVFTERRNAGALFIRPISARFMHAKERRKYAEILASLEK